MVIIMVTAKKFQFVARPGALEGRPGNTTGGAAQGFTIYRIKFLGNSPPARQKKPNYLVAKLKWLFIHCVSRQKRPKAERKKRTVERG